MNRQIQYKLHTQHNTDEKTINNMSTRIIESAAQHTTHPDVQLLQYHTNLCSSRYLGLYYRTMLSDDTIMELPQSGLQWVDIDGINNKTDLYSEMFYMTLLLLE